MVSINKIYFGDNLDILRRYIKDKSIDLTYLDPPFNSKKPYNIIYNKNAQVKAFEDTWHWTEEIQKTYEDIINQSKNDKIINAMESFRGMLGDNNLMAYLTMMSIRLIELYRVLKDDGSIYLHCDPTASHYLKIIMDNIFGVENFRNEIVWCYRGASTASSWFPRKHDIILFYSKGDKFKFNIQFGPHTNAQLSRYNVIVDGERYANMKGKLRKLGIGVRLMDWWEIPQIPNNSKERTGYPTQKPLALLERIIKAGSNPGDIVLDPFCGCATAMIASERLGRKWIGIDVTYMSIDLLKKRMVKQWGDGYRENHHFEVEGEPTTVEQAKQLIKERGRFRFQEWITVKVGGIPNTKKTGDKGEDGYHYFTDNKEIKKVIISVKSGHNIAPTDIRDLRGTIERQKADAGIFLTLCEPTKGMIEEAVSAGFIYDWIGKRYPKIQILTVEEILKGKRIDLPGSSGKKNEQTWRSRTMPFESWI